MAHLEPLDHIIWSADEPDEASLMPKLALMRGIRIVKIDRLFLTGITYDVLDRLNAYGVKIFIDGKIVEVPSKAVGIAQKHLVYRPWMLNCMVEVESNDLLEHPNPDKIDGLKRFADACLEAGTKPCAVTVLTSMAEEVVKRKFNGRTPVEQVLYCVEVLQRCGFNDIVCSPKEAEAIRNESRFNEIWLNMPGIRWPDSDTRDQARIGSPDGAMAAGGSKSRLVIGSLLTDSNEPGAELNRIANSIANLELAA
jgi:orotidine-5'-phosphate decarboxylase